MSERASFKLVPIEPDALITRAMAESQAPSDEGVFAPVCDLIDFSGANALHLVLAEAYRAAVKAVPARTLTVEQIVQVIYATEGLDRPDATPTARAIMALLG